MAKTRMVNTRFWNDSWVRKLNSLDRYLFLYLLTNEHTNICGIYELPIGTMAYESGIDERDLERTMLKRLKPKVYYIDEWVFLVNFKKHQQYNESVKIGMEKAQKDVPEKIMAKIKDILQNMTGCGQGVAGCGVSESESESEPNMSVKKITNLEEQLTNKFMYYYDDIKTIRKNKYKNQINKEEKSMLIKVAFLWVDMVSKKLGLQKEEVPVLNIYFPIRACWDRNPKWNYEDFKELFAYFLNDKLKDEDKISFDLCMSEKYTAKFKINKKNRKLTNASISGEIRL